MPKKSKIYTYRKYDYDLASITVNTNTKKEFDSVRKGKWDPFIKKVVTFIKKYKKEFDELSG